MIFIIETSAHSFSVFRLIKYQVMRSKRDSEVQLRKLEQSRKIDMEPFQSAVPSKIIFRKITFFTWKFKSDWFSILGCAHTTTVKTTAFEVLVRQKLSKKAYFFSSKIVHDLVGDNHRNIHSHNTSIDRVSSNLFVVCPADYSCWTTIEAVVVNTV